jgi:hypothetical protein
VQEEEEGGCASGGCEYGAFELIKIRVKASMLIAHALRLIQRLPGRSFTTKITLMEWRETPFKEFLGSATQKFKDGCSTIRACKGSQICPACDGPGCPKCHMTGFVTEYAHQQLAR